GGPLSYRLVQDCDGLLYSLEEGTSRLGEGIEREALRGKSGGSELSGCLSQELYRLGEGSGCSEDSTGLSQSLEWL
ncbi:unnamed protein product, partial [marine sediment metagenome]